MATGRAKVAWSAPRTGDLASIFGSVPAKLLIREASHCTRRRGRCAVFEFLSQGAPIRGLTVGGILMERCHHGVREPKRTSAHGRILDINERTDGAVTRIIGGRHSTIAAEEFVPVGDLDGRQVLGQRPASYGLKMGKTPRRHIFKYAKEILGAHDAPLSPPRSDPGERILYGCLNFEQCILNVIIARVADVWRVDTPRPMRDSLLLKLMSFPTGDRGGPSQQQRHPVDAADGVPRLLPYQASVGHFAAMKILKATSRTISTKFLPRQLPSRARWPQGGKRRRREPTQGNEAACHLTVTGEGDADFEGVAPALRFG